MSDLNSSDLLRVEDNEGTRSAEENATSPSWFDLFREIAERRCEPWRRELLSRAAKTEIESPNSISLKTLWSLSMLDDDIFNMFTIFLESSTYLNGYPSVIPEDEEQLVHAIVKTGKNSQTTLIIVLTKLLEHGLVSNSDFQLSSIEPIIGTTLKHSFELVHHIEPSDSTAQVTLRFSGYHCTDLGMDLARLCTPPKINLHSEIGLQSLISILKETSDVEIRVGVRG